MIGGPIAIGDLLPFIFARILAAMKAREARHG
jgi:hypothetical protein